MELLSYMLSQSVHWWYIERLLIFVNWFCILLLFRGCLCCLSFLMELSTSFRYKIMSSANRDSLITSFLICFPFISSYCLISLARNSKSILNKSGESGYPCLIFDFRGNGFSFPPFNVMLSVVLSYI
jgi:hypothetical protein